MVSVDKVLQFFGLQETPAQRMAKLDAQRSANALYVLRVGCGVVVGGYAVCILYKAGVISALLPKGLRTSLEQTVNQVKEKTEPRARTKMFTAARQHLLTTYTLMGGCWTVSALGSLAFFKFPHVPIAVPLVTTAVPTTLLFLTTPTDVPAVGRVSLAGLACFSLGYTFGPMNWVAFDSLAPFATIVCSTVAGFNIGLYLTRGTISYFLSSQLLSSALAVGATSVLAKETQLSTDVNAMLTLQLIANFGLGIGHTIPAISKFIQASKAAAAQRALDEEEPASPLNAEEKVLVDGLDPVKEAVTLYGVVCYGMWWLFRRVTAQVLRRLARDDSGALTKAEKKKLKDFAHFEGSSVAGDVIASVLFLLCYVKCVSIVQKADTTNRFEKLRGVFSALSPVAWVLKA